MEFMSRLTGRVALITGAQQGIGRAIAEYYAREGAAVVVNWLDDEQAADAIVKTASRQGVKSVAVKGDVTRPQDIESMFSAGRDLGGINVLVNNAAIFPRVDFLDMTEAEWDQMMDVNLKGVFRCAQTFARECVTEHRHGVMINFSSRAALLGSPRGVHYVTTKAGIMGLTRALALELAPHHIRVNAIAPGLTDTAQPRYGMTEAELTAAGQATPLGRIGKPEDMADMAVFLASDESRHITGQTLHVNGGDLFT
jgi:3-oxoacyl-[acyl-carrier protein] reductase